MAELLLKTKLGEKEFNVSLNEMEQKAYDRRNRRRYLRRSSLPLLLARIEGAKSIGELEKLTMSYDLCSFCDYKDFELEAAKSLSKSLVRINDDFPFARGCLDYIGSFNSYWNHLSKFATSPLPKAIGLTGFMDQKEILEFGRLMKEWISPMYEKKSRDQTWAFFMCPWSYFQCILIDESDVSPAAIRSLRASIEANEKSGFHPKKCSGLESVYFHELGHALDHLTNLSNGADFDKFWKSLSQEEIKKDLSIYGASCEKEFLAEAISEYYCSPKPREIAKKVYKMLQKRYAYVASKLI